MAKKPLLHYAKRGLFFTGLAAIISVPVLLYNANSYEIRDNPVKIEPTGSLVSRIKANLLCTFLDNDELKEALREYGKNYYFSDSSFYSDARDVIANAVRKRYEEIERRGNPEEVTKFLKSIKDLGGHQFLQGVRF